MSQDKTHGCTGKERRESRAEKPLKYLYELENNFRRPIFSSKLHDPVFVYSLVSQNVRDPVKNGYPLM